MRSFYFEYRLAPGDYRAASYFNNFGLKRFQGAFVVLAWAGSFLALALELAAFISRQKDTAYVILRVDDTAKAVKLIEKGGFPILREEEIAG